MVLVLIFSKQSAHMKSLAVVCVAISDNKFYFLLVCPKDSKQVSLWFSQTALSGCLLVSWTAKSLDPTQLMGTALVVTGSGTGVCGSQVFNHRCSGRYKLKSSPRNFQHDSGSMMLIKK
jgi:hypothetical protein